MTRLPSPANNRTQYFTGDRFVYVKEGFHPVLSMTGVTSSILCKICHTNQVMQCKRCNSNDHRTVDTHKIKIDEARSQHYMII